MFPSFVSLAVALLTAAFFYYVDKAISRRNASVPLAKNRWPLIGHLPLMLRYVRGRKTHELMQGLWERYGDVVALRFATQDLVVITDPTLIKRLCTEGTSFCKPDSVQASVQDIFFNGLFVMPTNDTWRMHRKALQPGFGPTHLKHATVASNSVGDELLADWTRRVQEAPGGTRDGTAVIEAHLHLACATLDVLGHVAFSHSFDHVRSLAHGDVGPKERFQAYSGVLRVMSGRMLMPRPLWYFTRARPSDVKPSTDLIKSEILRIISERKEQKSVSTEDSSKDFLDRLLGFDKFAPSDVIDEMVAFFVAGFETTAHTLTTCLMCVAQQPEVLRKLQQEVDAVIGADAQVTSENLLELKYTEWVIKETLRLYPTVPVIRRQAIRDVEMGGHVLCKGTQIIVNIQGVHRHPQHWGSDCQDFRPDRWANFQQEPGQFVPFSDGPHNCIGQKMALIESKSLLAKIACRFSWKVVPGQDLSIAHAVTAGLRNGLRIEIQPRHGW